MIINDILLVALNDDSEIVRYQAIKCLGHFDGHKRDDALQYIASFDKGKGISFYGKEHRNSELAQKILMGD